MTQRCFWGEVEWQRRVGRRSKLHLIELAPGLEKLRVIASFQLVVTLPVAIGSLEKEAKLGQSSSPTVRALMTPLSLYSGGLLPHSSQ